MTRTVGFVSHDWIVRFLVISGSKQLHFRRKPISGRKNAMNWKYAIKESQRIIGDQWQQPTLLIVFSVSIGRYVVLKSTYWPTAVHLSKNRLYAFFALYHDSCFKFMIMISKCIFGTFPIQAEFPNPKSCIPHLSKWFDITNSDSVFFSWKISLSPLSTFLCIAKKAYPHLYELYKENNTGKLHWS